MMEHQIIKKMKKIVIIVLVLAVVGGIVGYTIYNKPHADIAASKPTEVLTAEALYSAYESDELKANKRFLGKIIDVSGTVIQVNQNEGRVVSLVLEAGGLIGGVACLLDEVDSDHRQDFKVGESVKMRCVCTGKLMDVELNRCVEIN